MRSQETPQCAPRYSRFSALHLIHKRRKSSSASSTRRNLRYDRFIPDQTSMDMGIARCLLTQSIKKEDTDTIVSPSKEAYRRHLAETLLQNRTRILSFKSKPPTPIDTFYHESSIFDSNHALHIKSAKPCRHIPQSAERILDAPEIVDDYYLNLLDWGSNNLLAIALGCSVYLWDATTGSTSELVAVGEENGPVTSVSWAPDGKNIAIGLNNSDVQIWDSANTNLLRTLKGIDHHLQSRVGALSWNNHILSAGGLDGKIVNNDVRIRSPIVSTYNGHQQEVCGLKWAGSGQRLLASGGNDNLVLIWDPSMASSSSTTPTPNPTNQRRQWLHRFDDHMGAVKALSWCPFQTNLLASGGGESDRCIKFWNVQTGGCLKSVNTGSQVCSLLWSKKEREVLSSHGFTENQLILWKYPSMVKMAELTGHTSRVLFTALSPDGCTAASAAGDETLRFWNVFGTPEIGSQKSTTDRIPFSSFNNIIR